MYGEIVFYTHGSTIEYGGEIFPAGELTADILNFAPEDYPPIQRLLDRIKDLTEPRPYAMQGYELANNCIVTMLDDGIEVEYVRIIDDDMPFPPLFREAVAAKVAAELAMRIKHSLNLKQALESEFLTLIQHAELNNEIAKDTELVPDNSWVLVRQVWGD